MVRLLQLFLIFFPAVFSLQTAQHYELPKIAFFLVVGCGVLSCARAYEILVDGNFTFSVFKRVKWFFISGVVYLAYLIVNTFSALTPRISFWGSYERHQGLFLLLAIVFFTFLILTRIWKREETLSVLMGTMGGGLLVSLTALWQFISAVPFGDAASTLGRISGAAGHPNFLGQFLVATLLLHIFFIFHEQDSEKWRRILLRGSFFIQIFTLLATGNRASIIAFSIGLLLFGIYSYKNMLTEEVKLKFKPYFVRVLFLLLAVVLFYLSFKVFDGAFTRSILTRAYILPYVLEMISKSPFTGYGLDSFSYAFSPFFPKGMGETEGFMNMPDRAHNEILDILVEQGIIGAVIALTCLYTLFQYVRNTLVNKDKKSTEDLLLICTLFIILIALEISYLAGFSTTVTKVAAALTVALLLISAQLKPPQAVKSIVLRNMFAVLIVAIGTFYAVTGYKVYAGDVSYELAKKNENVSRLIESIDVSPYSYEYYVFGSDVLKEADDRIRFVEKAEKMNSYDYFVFLQKGRAYSVLKDEAKVRESFRRAEDLCPNCPLVPLYAGEAFYRLGNMTATKKYFEAYLSLTPGFYKKVYIEKLPLSSLSAYEQERLRIFLKENEGYLRFVEEVMSNK